MSETELLALLEVAKTNLSTALASPKPNYKVDDIEVKWSDYLKSLQETIDWIQVQLANLPSEEITIYQPEGEQC